MNQRDIARRIDHSVLHPTATAADILGGARLAVELGVAAYCVTSNAAAAVASALSGTEVALAVVVGFPHGNTPTAIKQAEARHALDAGAREIDMVVDIGAVVSGDWARAVRDIEILHQTVVAEGALLKVIFETGWLQESDIVTLCHICGDIGVAFIKTSTGFGHLKGPDGAAVPTGATAAHVALMRAHSPPGMGIKASGGIRTKADLDAMIAAGATRIGTSATEAILKEAAGADG